MNNKGRKLCRVLSRCLTLALAAVLLWGNVMVVRAEDPKMEAKDYLKGLVTDAGIGWDMAYYDNAKLVDSADKNLQAEKKLAECQAALNALSQQINTLPEEERPFFSDQLEKAKTELDDKRGEGTTELLNVVKTMQEKEKADQEKEKADQEEEKAAVTTEAVNGLLEYLENLQSAAGYLGKILNYYEEYLRTKSSVEYIHSRLEKVSGEADPSLTSTGIFNQQSAIDTVLADFFHADPEVQKNLLANMKTLADDADAYGVDIAVEAVQANRETQQNLAALQEQVLQGDAGSKLLGLIGTALGGVSVVLGILAMVFGLRSRTEVEPVDLSATASRADAEALSQQNRILRDNLEKMEDRVDALGAQLDQLTSRPAPVPGNAETKSAEGAKGKTGQEPAKVSRREPIAVGTLKLDYQSIAPDNSFLRRDPDGDYVLYDDGTISPNGNVLGKMNQMNGWAGSGLLYLFNVSMDGREYSSASLENARGYYIAKTVPRRAKVEEAGQSAYCLKSKGMIAMEKTY